MILWGPVQCSAARAACGQTTARHPQRSPDPLGHDERSRARPPTSLNVLKTLKARSRLRASLMALDVFHDVLDGSDLLRLLVRDLHVVLFLERHHQLDDVEGVRSEVLDEGGLGRDLFLA